MYPAKLLQQISFIKEIDKLKYIFRKTKLMYSDRPENDAEHSWHLAIMTILLAEYSNQNIDFLKVVKMVLIHSIVEIDAGDVFLYDTHKNHDNTEEERKAAIRIFGILPEDQAEELISLWEEFEAEETAEAKFAKVMDRLEPLLQNVSNDGGTWTEFGVKYDTVIQSKKAIQYGSTTLWEYAQQLLNDSVERGILKK